MKKVILILIIIIVLVSIFLLLKATIFKPSPKIEITLVENLSIEFLDKKKVSDFIISINGTITDDFFIDTTSIGAKTISFDFINDENRKASYSYEITIIDTVSPVIWLSNAYTVTVGEDISLTDKILCGDNYDDSPTKEIDGFYDLNTVGNYSLTFIAKDNSENETRKDFILKVVEKSTSSKQEIPKFTLFSDIIEKHKTNDTLIGIDISKWQEDVDFEKLKNAGVEFVIIRVGTEKRATGEYVLDPKFEYNITEANKYDIPVGLYYYSYADTVKHAIQDANWVLEQIKGYRVDLPIAFDWEDWNSFNSYQMSFYKLTACANAFLDTCTAHGYDGMLYSSKSYLEQIWLPTSYTIWLAHYTEQTNYIGDYMLWQLCDDGKVDGINGHVDINVWYK